MLYCGLDCSLRSCAGEVAHLQDYLSDTSVKKRLSTCVPWVKSLFSGVFGLEQVVNNCSRRFIDGSTVQEPGALATTYRLHIAIGLINLSIRQVEVGTDKMSENLDHYQLDSGDVLLIDRGYNQPKTLMPFLDRGGEVDWESRDTHRSICALEKSAISERMGAGIDLIKARITGHANGV